MILRKAGQSERDAKNRLTSVSVRCDTKSKLANVSVMLRTDWPVCVCVMISIDWPVCV